MFTSGSFKTFQFLIIFLILIVAFYSYVGIVSPGGNTYSSFLDQYANFPAWLSYFICKGAKLTLEIAGYSVYQKAPNNITISGSRNGVNIIWACLGFGVMSFWIAFITAHITDWKYKLKWVIAGVLLIIGINILRIALIALGVYYNWKRFNSIEPHLAFNIVSYIAIIILTFWFTIKYRRRASHKQQ